MGDEPFASLLLTHRTTQTQNKCKQTSMPRVEFEPMTPIVEQVKTVYTLDCAVTVISLGSTQY
jgi:hypothetical protein